MTELGALTAILQCENEAGLHGLFGIALRMAPRPSDGVRHEHVRVGLS